MSAEEVLSPRENAGQPPENFRNADEALKRAVYTHPKDKSMVIDAQIHIYDEIPTPENAELRDKVKAWVQEHAEYVKDPEYWGVYFTDAQVFRFCRARQFKFDKICQMIEETIQWRLRLRPDLIRYADLKREARSGKTAFHRGFDQYGRSCLVLHNEVNDSADFEAGMRLALWHLEKSARDMDRFPNGPSHGVTFMNMTGFSYSNQPPMNIAKEVAYAISTAYPERLGLCVIFNGPFLFRAFYKTIASLILDERTKSKVIFVKDSDSDLDEKMNFYIGPNWRQLTGVGQPVFGEKVSPGFDPEAYNTWCAADDLQRFGTTLSTAEEAEEKKRLEEAAAALATATPVDTTVDTSTTVVVATQEKPDAQQDIKPE